MKKLLFNMGALLILLILISIGQNTILAEELLKHEDCFVDLDGDGFNDQSFDFNNDKIAGLSPPANVNESRPNYMSFDAGLDSENSIYLTKSEKFDLLKSEARGLDENRRESDSDFGGNLGGMAGSGSSGGCAGGACIAN